MSRRAEGLRRAKYAREAWGEDPDRGGNLGCRHDRNGPCECDWRDDEVAVAALRVLVDSGGDVLSHSHVKLTLRHEHGLEAPTNAVKRSLYLLGRYHLVDRVADGTDGDGYPVFRWRASLTRAREALASVAA